MADTAEITKYITCTGIIVGIGLQGYHRSALKNAHLNPSTVYQAITNGITSSSVSGTIVSTLNYAPPSKAPKILDVDAHMADRKIPYQLED